MTVAQIAYHKPQTDAFEKFYFSLSRYPRPLAYIQSTFVETMEKTGVPAFKLPKKYSANHKDAWFVFKLYKKDYGHIYLFDRVIVDGLPFYQFDPDKDYSHWYAPQKKRLTV